MEGVVAIPRDLLEPVMELMPKLISMDDQAKNAVAQGMTVAEAFKTFGPSNKRRRDLSMYLGPGKSCR